MAHSYEDYLKLMLSERYNRSIADILRPAEEEGRQLSEFEERQAFDLLMEIAKKADEE